MCRPGHFARDCPDSEPGDLDRRPRNFPCKDGPRCQFRSLPVGCRYFPKRRIRFIRLEVLPMLLLRYQHDDFPSGRESDLLVPADLDRRPRNFPCKDGPGCKFLSLPVGCRYFQRDGSDLNPCYCLGTNTMNFQVDEVLLGGQLLSAIAAMDLVTLLATVQHQLEFAEALCQEVEGQFEGQWFTPAESNNTQPLWSATSATRLDTLPETVPEVEEGLKSAT